MSKDITPKEFIVKWNYLFPADRWWRKKYNIPLFSEQHLSQSQLDIALEYYEDKLFESITEQGRLLELREKDYEKGKLLIDIEDTLSEEEKDKLFEKLDINQFNV